MFWGVRLQPGRKYSQEVSNAYQITKAVLETPVDGSQNKNSKRVHVMLSTGNEEFVLCTLDQSNVERNMDLFFSTGEKVCLFLKGEGNVHLTGYVIEPEEDEEYSDEENPFVSAEDFAKAINGNKRAVKLEDSSNKRAKLMNEDENDDEDEEDEDFLGALDEEYDSMDDEDFDEMDDEMDGEESEEEEVPVPVQTKMNGSAKKGQQQQQQQQQQQKKGQQTPQAQKGQQQQQQKKGQPTPQAQKGQQQQQQKQNPQVQKAQQQQQGKKGVFTPPAKFVSNKTVEGMDIYDINAGSGPIAKRGKMVHVKYIGRLPNNKEFDRSTNKPFSFRLGAGEVIQGWDKGIEGMKVGGKRRLYIPPKLGYGNRGTGPIPGNSHLDFEVELLRVS